MELSLGALIERITDSIYDAIADHDFYEGLRLALKDEDADEELAEIRDIVEDEVVGTAVDCFECYDEVYSSEIREMLVSHMLGDEIFAQCFVSPSAACALAVQLLFQDYVWESFLDDYPNFYEETVGDWED